MQKQINIESDPALKQIHKLMIIELCLKEIIHRDLGRSTGNLDGALWALEEEDTDLVAGNGKVDAVVIAGIIAIPGDKNTLVNQLPRRILVAAKFRLAAGALQFTLVVVLLGKGKEKPFFTRTS